MFNEQQEEKLEREFRQEYHLITRQDRLQTIARDLVQHFLNRGFMGKGMMVCIDRFTTVRMYDLVKGEWKAEEQRVKDELKSARSVGAGSAAGKASVHPGDRYGCGDL